ncbi:MAG: radical SAM family heme chaperone HemW [Clostridia bacterium]|nr:radical SAM family heme chaperone HemW [Clostridia bacterium]
MMTTKAVGLYVHIPFCVRKCNYCDFCSKAPTATDFDRYFERLETELSRYLRSPKIRVDSIFVGGGTPSILPRGYFTRLFEMIKNTFEIDGTAEITTEINPGTLTREKAEEYRTVGINRVSIGLQSVHENELKILGRIHGYDDFLASYNLLREVGFDNISVDLMYGIPAQTKDSFKKTLDTVTSLNPTHISLYGLIIEPGTPFGDACDSLLLPTEDEECDMYYMAAEYLARLGYTHYEISNYARPGFECRHNLKYWHAEEYIGIGAAAHSFFEGRRYGNSRALFDITPDADADDISTPAEYVMMRLRLREGFSLSEYKRLYGIDFLNGKSDTVSTLAAHGLLITDGDRICLTEAGFYVSNSIIAELL